MHSGVKKTKGLDYLYTEGSWSIVKGQWDRAGLYLEHICSYHQHHGDDHNYTTYRYDHECYRDEINRPGLSIVVPCGLCREAASEAIRTLYVLLGDV